MKRELVPAPLLDSRGSGRGGSIATVGEILALGYFRYRRKLAVGGPQEGAQPAEKPLDDVAPEGRVTLPENRTPEKGGGA